MINSYTSDIFVRHFLNWVDRQDAHWARFINLMDAHYPYRPNSEHDHWGCPSARQFQDRWANADYEDDYFDRHESPWWQLQAIEGLYDGGIRQLDAAIKRIISQLKAMGEFSDSLIIITSDHGEAFGEKSEIDAGTRQTQHTSKGGISEINTHIPLLVKKPGQQNGEIVQELANISKFPYVANSFAIGEDIKNGFAVNDTAVASIRQPRSRGSAFAVYGQVNDNILKKYSMYGDISATVYVNDRSDHCLLRHDNGRRVKREFEDRGIRIQKDRDVKNNFEYSEVYEGLGDLGYL